jgi:SAM-dependent methyltransferase
MKSTVKKLVPAGVRRSVKLRLHSGDRYTCPFCGYTAKDLETIGEDFPILKELDVVGGGRRAAACHRCGSLDRERLVYVYLSRERRIFDSSRDLRVLHIAPEKHLAQALDDAGLADYVCGDLFTEGYKYHPRTRNMNVLDIPFDDDTFDLVICNHVLEHIPDDAAAMRELRRVLRPGGTAILQVPISTKLVSTLEDPSIVEPRDRERVFGQFDHVRLYGQDYADRLRDSGFTVTTFKAPENHLDFGVNPDEELFICSK